MYKLNFLRNPEKKHHIWMIWMRNTQNSQIDEREWSLDGKLKLAFDIGHS